MRLSERFVLCELTGGLGNQLFQYAAARALSLREARTLYFAWHLPRSATARRFMLDAYQLGPGVERAPLSRATLVRLGLRSPLAPRKAGPRWRRLCCRLHTINEPAFAYQPLSSPHPRVVVDGYFQSWRYFADYAERLRAELSLRVPLSAPSQVLLRQIEAERSVCLHIRRGDYVHDAQTAAFHGALDLSYYRAGLEALGSAAEGATVYVFSDDPAWSRQHVQLGRNTVVVDACPPHRPWEDLRLMSACQHFVTANSSFSWWGAWLSRHPEKRVVAPKRWFAGAQHDTSDLCPPDWMRL